MAKWRSRSVVKSFLLIDVSSHTDCSFAPSRGTAQSTAHHWLNIWNCCSMTGWFCVSIVGIFAGIYHWSMSMFTIVCMHYFEHVHSGLLFRICVSLMIHVYDLLIGEMESGIGETFFCCTVRSGDVAMNLWTVLPPSRPPDDQRMWKHPWLDQSHIVSNHVRNQNNLKKTHENLRGVHVIELISNDIKTRLFGNINTWCSLRFQKANVTQFQPNNHSNHSHILVSVT